MNRYGLVLAAILAASPVSATNVTTWANVTTCHKCAERYGVRAMNLRECPADWPEGADRPAADPHATPAQIAGAEHCIRSLTRRKMNRP
jgi:hypothetical protein